jgi:hypothetical protein
MKVEVGVSDAVLGIITLTPRGLRVDGAEKEVLERLVDDYRRSGLGDAQLIERLLHRLQGYTWAVEVPEGPPA